MIIRLDVSKAYDRVRWSFLLDVLLWFGFDKKWVQCIKHCVSSVNFSILVNGSMCGFFQATNGLRRGDPMSPFLFVLMAEALGRNIKNRLVWASGEGFPFMKIWSLSLIPNLLTIPSSSGRLRKGR